MDIKKVSEVLLIYKKAGYKAYLVGGSSRDLLFSRETNDIDIATNAPMNFTSKTFEVIDTSGKSMGSLHINYKNTKMDITCFRTETYDYKSTYPKVDKYIQDEEEDAKRRDFTVNAIYLDTTNNQVVDPYNGIGDMMNYTLRLIGDPITRIKEDPTRIIRGLRVAYKYNFAIEENTNNAFKELSFELKRVTSNRLAKEIDKMLADLGEFKTNRILNEYKIERKDENDNQ